jgi:cytochrome c oxidase assembly factor CtaG
MKRKALNNCILYGGAALLAGILCVAPPVDHLADRSFTWHMLQHLTLFFCVSLLVVLTRPFDLLAAFAGKPSTAALVRAARPLHVLAAAPTALGLYVATLWLAHFSGLYESSLENAYVHVLEHGIFLAAGIVFWLPVIAPAPLRPPNYPARLLYLAVALPQGALVSMALYSAREPLYGHYAALLGPANALKDQHDAAALMWIAGGLIVLSAFLATIGGWARRERLGEAG